MVGFYYSYWIAGYTASKIKQISFNIIGWIKNRKNIDEIIKGLDEKTEVDTVYKRSRENLDNDDVYGERWLRPLLVAIEYRQTDDSKSREGLI